jgi:integrase
VGKRDPTGIDGPSAAGTRRDSKDRSNAHWNFGLRNPNFKTAKPLRHGLLVAAGLALVRRRNGNPRAKVATPSARSEVTFHSLRHTAASLLKNAGVSETVARDIIGHESAAISRHYTHIHEGSKRKALAKLPDITAAPKKAAPPSSSE